MKEIKSVSEAKLNREKEAKKIRLIFSNLFFVFMCLIISILYASKTFGWFSSNKAAEAQKISPTISGEDIGCLYSLYAYDLSKQEATETRLVKNDSGQYVEIKNYLSDFTLNTHDAIFEELNEYTTVLVEIKIYGKKIQRDSTGTIRLNIYRDDSKSANPSNELYEYISNIFDFKACLSNTIRNAATVNSKWNAMKDLIDDENSVFGDGVRLVSKSGSTYTTSNHVYIDCTYTSSDIYESEKGKTISIFLVIDYNEELTQAILNQSDFDPGSTDFSISSVIQIYNDLNKLEIEVVEEEVD